MALWLSLHRQNQPARFFVVLALLCVLTACDDSVKLAGPTDQPSPEPVSGNDPDNTGPYTLARHNSTFTSTHYAGAAQCSSCHDGITDARGNDVSVNEAWSASMMAQSARDPYWIARVAAELERHSAHADEINQTCSRCHAPMANDAAQKEAASIQILGSDGILSATSPYFDHAMDGVSCTLCHQISDDGRLGTPAGASGNFTIQSYNNPSDRPAYGSYVDPVAAYMVASVQFNPVYGAHMTESRVCAACHDLFTPTIDAQTGMMDSDAPGAGFPEQMVFSEWAGSAYARTGPQARSCQDCHMPVAEGTVQIATRGATLQRSDFSRHDFLGANTVMQTLLRDHREQLGISTRAETFDTSIARNRAFLASAATLEFVAQQRTDQTLVSQLRITNQTGHKLPSGFLSRRVFVHYVVSDASGNIVFESGALQPDGSLQGADSDTDYTRYEPHHERIDSPDQVQIYEAVVADSQQSVTHSPLSAAFHLKDNRLLPAGLDKLNAPENIRVHGQAFRDNNFTAASDTVTYAVALTGSGPWQVKAELLYQPLGYPHLQELFTHSDLPEVAAFRTMLESSTLSAEVIAITTAVVD